jgi:hypothetical protein
MMILVATGNVFGRVWSLAIRWNCGVHLKRYLCAAKISIGVYLSSRQYPGCRLRTVYGLINDGLTDSYTM